jgi:hypothetical protein
MIQGKYVRIGEYLLRKRRYPYTKSCEKPKIVGIMGFIAECLEIQRRPGIHTLNTLTAALSVKTLRLKLWLHILDVGI